MSVSSKKIKIAIVGAGFSGAALAANLVRYQQHRLEISLIDKRAVFGLGEAYSTPYPYHLLNVRAHDMSAFEESPDHFVEWLQTILYPQDQLDINLPLPKRFVPRMMYGKYVQNLIHEVADQVTLIANEVIDIDPQQNAVALTLRDGQQIQADKVALALGNGVQGNFPFPVSGVKCINNPWDFSAPTQIPTDDTVLIIGTGLSMIDVMLTLRNQNHRGKIYALSRHGLLPLPHTENHIADFDLAITMHETIAALTKKIRTLAKTHRQAGGDWRSIVQALRPLIPSIWSQATIQDKKRFIRHVLPYWSVHRHRVHQKLAAMLQEMMTQGQLEIIAGRVLEIDNGIAKIKLRHVDGVRNLPTQWVINCMGPSQMLSGKQQPLIAALERRGLVSFDELNLGFSISPSGNIIEKSGKPSPFLYALGPPTKGMAWETIAVPEIRKQCLTIARHINSNKE